jgi:hypothetical protein
LTTQAAIRELQERANVLQKRKSELQTELMYGPPPAAESEADKLANKARMLEYTIAEQERRLGLPYSGLKLGEVLTPEEEAAREAAREASWEKSRVKQEEERKKYEEWLAKQVADTDPFAKLADVEWTAKAKAVFTDLWTHWSFERKAATIKYLSALSKETRQRKISSLADVIDALAIAVEGIGPHLDRAYVMKLPIEFPDADDAGCVIQKFVSGTLEDRSLARRLSNTLDEGIERLKKVEAEAWSTHCKNKGEYTKFGDHSWVDGQRVIHFDPAEDNFPTAGGSNLPMDLDAAMGGLEDAAPPIPLESLDPDPENQS